jgi:ribonuclease J
MTNNILRILPLGGLGEIGRNMMVYEYGEKLLIVDSGIMFPENEMLGVDYIIPDMQYLVEKRDQVVGIIVTHGHEDHIGAIHHLLENVSAPIYATQLTRGLLEVKLARYKLLENTEINTVQAGETRHIGPFQVEFFHMSHSIPDSVGLGIETPAGLVVHSGDFKFDQTPVDNWPSDFAKLSEFSRRGVMALMADSTNAEEPGWTPSERTVDAAFEQVFDQAPGRIIIASFASLISRIQQVANAAGNHGRKMAFAGTSMIENSKMALKLGYLEIPDDVLISLDQALGMKNKKVVLMCTGTQGEPTSILGRLSTGTHRHIDIKEGDTVVLSSQAIPGNEESVYRTINRLFQRGANVIYERIAPVHVSGHASQDEIKLLLNLVRPKYFIPMHGEHRHLRASSQIAQQMGIPAENIMLLENGHSVEFDSGRMQRGKKVPYSYVFVDGSVVGDVGPDVMNQREQLGENGIVIVNLQLDQNGKLIKNGLSMTSYGFMASQEAEKVLADAHQPLTDALSGSSEDIEKSVFKALRTYLYSETRRRPRVFVNISQI